MPQNRSLPRVGLALTLVLALAIPLATQFAGASSHREAPMISYDPAADTTDMYVFRSPDAPDTITAIMNVWPFMQPEGGPNWYLFDPNVRYSMHITNDGDAEEEIRLDFRFRTDIRSGDTFLRNTGPIRSLNDPNFNLRQFYSVDLVAGGQSTRLGENIPVPPPNIGPKSFPDGYERVANQAITNIPSIPGGKVFAGPRDDPFFVDLGATFDLINVRPGLPGNSGGGVDQLAGLNVLSIAVQVPISAVVRPECTMSDPTNMDCVVGMWITTSRPQMSVLQGESPPNVSGDFVQVSRLSAALVNEVVVPLAGKDVFNASDPQNDERFLALVQDPLPARILNALFDLPVPPTPRNDIVTIFSTGIPNLNQPPNVEPAEIAHLNVAIPLTAQPNRMGVLGGDNQGYPNGRRLIDDVVDISLQAVAGGTPFTPEFNMAPNNQLGDGVNQNDRPFVNTFPYLASPHQGFQHDHHRLEPRTTAAAPAPAEQAAPDQPVAQPRTGNSGLSALQVIYTVQEGDTLASISEAVYGTPDLAGEILATNLDILSSAEDLQPNMVLTLPAASAIAPAGS